MATDADKPSVSPRLRPGVPLANGIPRLLRDDHDQRAWICYPGRSAGVASRNMPIPLGRWTPCPDRSN